jgi:hypothetical protein
MNRRRRKAAVVLGAVVLAALASAAIAVATGVNHGGPVTKFDGRDEILHRCTTSTSFSTLPQMNRKFMLGGTGNASVAVMFSGSLSLSGDPSDTGYLRLLVDGVQQAPGVIPAIGAGERGAQAFNWQTKPLAPGSHRVKISWRTDLHGSFCADARSMIMLHQ